MADFVQKSINKSATRDWIVPLSLSDINALITEITGAGNPFATSSYVEGGETIAGAMKGKEAYTGLVVYENAAGKIVGTIALRTKTQASLADGVDEIVRDTALTGFMGGDPVRNTEDEAYSVAVRCHDTATSENYVVTLARKKMTVSSYGSDSILTRIETWADGKPNLN